MFIVVFALAEMAYYGALGLDVVEVLDYRVGIGMAHLSKDFAAARNSYRRGETGVSALVLSWLRARSTVFSWSDPIPALVWWGEIVFARVRRLMFGRK